MNPHFRLELPDGSILTLNHGWMEADGAMAVAILGLAMDDYSTINPTVDQILKTIETYNDDKI